MKNSQPHPMDSASNGRLTRVAEPLIRRRTWMKLQIAPIQCAIRRRAIRFRRSGFSRDGLSR
ncbi:hypothetical protein GGR71_002987 [Xanthomonas sp. F1]|uniref:hypothetical protein n=1 Tax=Xanthomonas sp. LMG 8992 TaxID=1591157 RepID=UPI001370F06C|nr:hypothetical protein [Xanthomonas sp. LMG 8992]